MFQAARLHNFDGSVVVAVIAVGMVQPALDQIIDMIVVRHRFMTTVRSMNMLRLMARMAKRRRAAIRIRGTDLDRMLFDDVALLMVQVAVMKVVDVIAVLDRGVAAARSVPMRMVGMDVVCHDRFLSFLVTVGVCLLAGVLDRVVDEVQNVRIGDRIENCLSFTPSLQQPSRRQDLETGRRRCDLFLVPFGELADAHLASCKTQHHPQPMRVGERLEHLGSQFQADDWRDRRPLMKAARVPARFS